MLQYVLAAVIAAAPNQPQMVSESGTIPAIKSAVIATQLPFEQNGAPQPPAVKMPDDINVKRESPNDAALGAALWLQQFVAGGGLVNIDGNMVSDISRLRFLSMYNLPIEAERTDPKTGMKETYSPLEETALVLAWVINQTNRINPPATLIKITPTLYAVSLDAPGWDAQSWDTIASKDAYFHPNWISEEIWTYLISVTGSPKPIMRADQFIKLSTLAPDYYNLLFGYEKVKTLDAMFEVMGVQDKFLKSNLKIKAGVKSADLTVTLHNRRLERREGAFDVWTSIDTINNKGDRNALRQLGYVSGTKHELVKDGQEHIIELGNGHFAGFLNDKDGNRVDEVPISIAAGEDNYRDRVVKAGRSCITCHELMVKPFKSDQYTLLKKQTVDLSASNPKDAMVLTSVYDEDNIQESIRLDQEAYTRTLNRLYKTSGETMSEKFKSTWKRYEENQVDINTAAADMGVNVAEATVILIPSTDPNLLMLITPNDAGGTMSIARDTWEEVYSQAMALKGKPNINDIVKEFNRLIPPNLIKKLSATSQSGNKVQILEVVKPTIGGSVTVELTIKNKARPVVKSYKSDHNSLITMAAPDESKDGDLVVMKYTATIKVGPNGEFPSYIDLTVDGDTQPIRFEIKTKTQ